MVKDTWTQSPTALHHSLLGEREKTPQSAMSVLKSKISVLLFSQTCYVQVNQLHEFVRLR